MAGIREHEGAIKALLRLKQDVLWFEFGHPTTAWTNDASPPTPIEGAADIEQPYLYVRTDLVTLCRQATSNTEYQATDSSLRITLNAVEYIYVTDINAYSQIARWLLLRATINVASGMPVGTFRQVRVLNSLQPISGYECDSWLLPVNVSVPGLHEWTENMSAVTTSSVAATEQYILLASG